MSEKITGVCVDIPTVIRKAKFGDWVSVEERLPPLDQRVLLLFEGDCPTDLDGKIVTLEDDICFGSFGHFEDDGILGWTVEGVDGYGFLPAVSPHLTHWMEVPAPPSVKCLHRCPAELDEMGFAVCSSCKRPYKHP